MKQEEHDRRVHEIVLRLMDLAEQDRCMIQARASTPVVISLGQLFAYGERDEERQKLHAELRELALPD